MHDVSKDKMSSKSTVHPLAFISVHSQRRAMSYTAGRLFDLYVPAGLRVDVWLHQVGPRAPGPGPKPVVTPYRRPGARDETVEIGSLDCVIEDANCPGISVPNSLKQPNLRIYMTAEVGGNIGDSWVKLVGRAYTPTTLAKHVCPPVSRANTTGINRE